MQEHAQRYEEELRERVIPFWEGYCPDREFGGYFTCLDRDGSVYDTTKFMWMQWRIVWMFSHLYSTLEQNAAWLDLARSGYEFLVEHGTDEKGRTYFAVARDGTPAAAPYSAYADAFAAMGAAAYFHASGDEAAREEALRAYRSYRSREQNPKGEWNKSLPGATSYRSLGFYMLGINLAQVMDECIGMDDAASDITEGCRIVMNDFLEPERYLLMENVPPGGGFDFDSMAGRHHNPGHALEAAWFILQAVERYGGEVSVDQIARLIESELALGWDEEYGGIFYFMDVMKKPHVDLQWNMKLWWVHNEALVAAWMASKATGRPEFEEWFERIHQWTWSCFPDPEYGEWYGYLDRFGNVTHSLKGGKWKTFFHLPRSLQILAAG